MASGGEGSVEESDPAGAICRGLRPPLVSFFWVTLSGPDVLGSLEEATV